LWEREGIPGEGKGAHLMTIHKMIKKFEGSDAFLERQLEPIL